MITKKFDLVVEEITNYLYHIWCDDEIFHIVRDLPGVHYIVHCEGRKYALHIDHAYDPKEILSSLCIYLFGKYSCSVVNHLGYTVYESNFISSSFSVKPDPKTVFTKKVDKNELEEAVFNCFEKKSAVRSTPISWEHVGGELPISYVNLESIKRDKDGDLEFTFTRYPYGKFRKVNKDE
jgi:hypothetical protein